MTSWETLVIIVAMEIKCKAAECPNTFVRVWPNTKQIYCSRKCYLHAFYLAHKDSYYAWVAANPDKVKRNKARYREGNREKLAQAGRDRYARDPKGYYQKQYGTIEQRRPIYARQRSRRRLLKAMPLSCSQLQSGGCRGRVECHHRDENPHNDALANLVWLCKLHHAQEHCKE